MYAVIKLNALVAQSKWTLASAFAVMKCVRISSNEQINYAMNKIMHYYLKRKKERLEFKREREKSD